MRTIVGLTLALILAGCGATTVAPSPSASKPSSSGALPTLGIPRPPRSPSSAQAAAFQAAFCSLMEDTSEALSLESRALAAPIDVARFRAARVQLDQSWAGGTEAARALPEWDDGQTLAKAMVDLTDLHVRKLEAFESFMDGETSIEEWGAFDTASDDLTEVIGTEWERLTIFCTFPRSS